MEATLVLGALITLALSAARWGHDSRPRESSKEVEQALWGLTWSERPTSGPAGPHVRPERSALATTLRARAAAADARRRAA